MAKTFEGKLTALFRKLEFNGKTYYQCDFVVPETTPGNRFDNLNNRLSSNKLQFYDTGTEEELNAKGFKEKTIFHLINSRNKVFFLTPLFPTQVTIYWRSP